MSTIEKLIKRFRRKPIPMHGNVINPAYIQELNELFELIEKEGKK